MRNQETDCLGSKKFEVVRRKAIKLSSEELISTEYPQPGQDLPVVIKPGVEGLAVAAWAEKNQELIKKHLSHYGAILFRSFDITTPREFEQFIKTTSSGEMLEYRDRSSPRTIVKDKIYTSTEYPADQRIFLHNEGTYWLTWPLKIYFFCMRAPEKGGETPIANSRNIYARISPRIKERFVDKQVLYVRNYNDGFGLTWQTVFQTTDKNVVEKYCRVNRIEVEWKDGDRLRTRQIRQAVAQHPYTGDMLWFNHATFFHVSTLEPTMRDALLAEFKEEDLPFNTYFGDGSRIEPSVLDEMREAYWQETVSFPWQQDDVLMLDNMLTAHGRAPYEGERKVLAGMAEPFSAYPPASCKVSAIPS
jgi:alpha-ketoglutarate-dependent taurine dioxygenase